MTAGLGPFTAGGRETQDFGPGIKPEPDRVWAQRDAGGWRRASFLRFAGAVKVDDFHFGVDEAAKLGTPTLAPERSRIVLRGEDPYSGLYIIGEISPGLFYFEGHLSAYVAKQGAEVKRGETIGRMGKSGLYVTGVHTHSMVFTMPVGVSVRHYYTRAMRYNPRRLQVGGDLAGWGRLRPA